jgi:hypothetical protein
MLQVAYPFNLVGTDTERRANICIPLCIRRCVLLLAVLYSNSSAYSNAVIVILTVIVISSVQPRYDIDWNVTVVSYTYR